MKERLDYLDVAKGIGIILVMMGHSCGIILFGDYITAFYMAMFFVAAGYVYKPGKYSVKENIKKRSKRILVPYFAYNALLFLYYILKGIAKHDLNMKESLLAVLGVFYSRNYLWTDSTENVYFFKLLNDPVWFLTAMFTASVIFFIIVDSINNIKKCVIISIMLIAASAVMSRLPVLLPWSIDSAPLYAFFMLMGALMAKYRFFDRIYSICQYVLLLLAFVLSVFLRCWNGKTNMSVRVYGNHGMSSVAAAAYIGVAGTAVLFYIAKLLCREIHVKKILSYIGQNTMAIMALHMAVFQIEDMAAGKVLGGMLAVPAVYWTYSVAKIAVAAAVSIGVGKIMSKVA